MFGAGWARNGSGMVGSGLKKSIPERKGRNARRFADVLRKAILHVKIATLTCIAVFIHPSRQADVAINALGVI